MIATPDHLLLDSVLNIGPLISCLELDKFKNCWNRSFRTSKILTLLYHQFLTCECPNKVPTQLLFFSEVKGLELSHEPQQVMLCLSPSCVRIRPSHWSIMICIIFSAEFRCSNGQCVAKRWRCDGDEGCDDGSDKRQERLHRCRRWPLPRWVSNKWRWRVKEFVCVLIRELWVLRFICPQFFFCLRRWRFQVHSEELAVRQEQGLSRRFQRGWMRWVAHATAISDPHEFIYLLYSYLWTVSTSLITGTW
jgi:hypothetical protein